LEKKIQTKDEVLAELTERCQRVISNPHAPRRPPQHPGAVAAHRGRVVTTKLKSLVLVATLLTAS
jgi:hypothetical protein